MTPRLPDFMIIGAMKCATSALHEQLARQQQFFMSTPKEPNFFSDDENYSRGIEWYARLFEGSPGGIICGESSTNYTKLPTHPNTIRRIKRHFRSIKFVYVMRHPVDRLVSHYIHEWTQGEMSGPIDQAVYRWPQLIDYGRYAMQLEPYRDAFGKESILPVFQERLLSRPQREFDRICEFLGATEEVSWRSDLGPVNASNQRNRKSAIRDAIVRAPGAGLLKRALPAKARESIKGLWRMSDRPELDGKTAEFVEAVFDRDLEKLGQWLGLELTCSTFREAVGGDEAPDWASARTGRKAG